MGLPSKSEKFLEIIIICVRHRISSSFLLSKSSDLRILPMSFSSRPFVEVI